MQKFFNLLLAFTMLVTLPAYSQAPVSNDNLEWNEFYKLQWHDFQGRRTEESIGDAATAVQIKAKPFYVKDKIEYDVYAYFNRTKSWTSEQSDALLAHEQLHFDIAELYARKIRKLIHELRQLGVNDTGTYNKHIRELLEASNEADQRYDMETLHGAMVRKQAAWEKKVKDELETLAEFKKKKRVISFHR